MGILLLLLMGDIRVLEELLLLLGHTSELTGGQVEADMHEMDWFIWNREFRTLGRHKEV